MNLTKKQKEVFDFICDYTAKEGISPSQKEIKEYFELKSFGSVQRYLQYLMKAGLIEQDWNAKRGIKILKSPSQIFSASTPPPQEEIIKLPLLGKAAAGSPIEAIENCDDYLKIPGLMIPPKVPQNKLYALKIAGDSMIEDGIHDGDIIICQHQNSAQNGETVVALIDNEATVKKFYRQKNKVELHPANPFLKPFIFTAEDQNDLRITGKVIALLRNYAS